MLRSRPVHLRGAGASNVPIPTIAISPLRSRLRNNNSSNSNNGLPLYTSGAVGYRISQCRNITSARYLTSATSSAAALSALSSRERFNFPANGLIPAARNSVSARVQLQSAHYHSGTSSSPRKPPQSKSYPDRTQNRDTRSGAKDRPRSYPNQNRNRDTRSGARSPSRSYPNQAQNGDTRFGAKSNPRSYPKSHPRAKEQSRAPFKPSYAKDELEERPEYPPRDRNRDTRSGARSPPRSDPNQTQNRDTRSGARGPSRSYPKSPLRAKEQSRAPFKPSYAKDGLEERPRYSPRDRNRDTRFGAKSTPRSYPKSQSRAPFKPSYAKDGLEERPEYSPRDRNRDTRFGAKSSPRSYPKSHSHAKLQSRGPFKPFQTKDELEELPEYSTRDQDDKDRSYDPKTLSAMAMRKDAYERAMAGIAKRRLAFAHHVERVFHKGGFEKALSLVISAEKFSVNALRDDKVHCDSAWNFLLDQMIQSGQTDGAIRVFNYMKKLGAVPTAYTYTILFRGLAKSPSKSAPKKAIHLYESMLAENSVVKPNIIHTNAALGVCTRHNDMDSLWEMSSRLPEYGEDKADATTYTIILHAIQASTRARIERFQMDEYDVKKAFKLRRQVVSEGKKLWSDVIYKARRAKLVIDQKLVSSMGRLLLFGQHQSDHRDIFALLHQCMNIPLPDETFGSNSVTLKKWHHFRNPKPTPSDELTEAEQKGDETAPQDEVEKDPFKTLLFDEAGIREIKNIRKMKPEFKKIPFEIPTPTGEDLSLILEACTSMKNGIAIGRHYWSELTSPDKYKIEPDPPAFHDYLRLLRISRASAESLAVIQKQMVPKNMAVAKTYIIAMSTCSRDRNNLNVLHTTTSLMDTMLLARSEPLIKPLMKYIEFIWILISQPRLAADIRMQQKLETEKQQRYQQKQAATENDKDKENNENIETKKSDDAAPLPSSSSPSPSSSPPTIIAPLDELHKSRLSQTLKHMHPHLNRIINLLAFGHWKKKLEPKRAKQEPELDPLTIVDNLALWKLGKNISPTDPSIPCSELVEVLDEAYTLHKRLLGPQLAPLLSGKEREVFQKVADRLEKFTPFAESLAERRESDAEVEAEEVEEGEKESDLINAVGKE